MIVMFAAEQPILILGIIDSDQKFLDDGRTLTYENPPHRPQLVRDIVVFRGKDKADVIRLMREAGLKITEHQAKSIIDTEGRTDRPRKPF